VRAAVSVELVHGATLVHDDVLDGSPLRRGRPTVVAAGGRHLATATGDLLFSRAFAELAEGESLAAVRVLSRASSELAEGELMQRADAWNAEVAVDRYLARCRLRPPCCFEPRARLRSSRAWRAADSRVIWRQIGLAFQILDDVLDVTGPPERTGKPRGRPARWHRDASADLARSRGQSWPPWTCVKCVRRSMQPPSGPDRGSRRSGDLEGRAMDLVEAAGRAAAAAAAPPAGALELVADGVIERYS
jgi:hypothetical protein